MDLFAMSYEEPVKTNVVNRQCFMSNCLYSHQFISILVPINQ